jgi:hypothetical protein
MWMACGWIMTIRRRTDGFGPNSTVSLYCTVLLVYSNVTAQTSFYLFRLFLTMTLWCTFRQSSPVTVVLLILLLPIAHTFSPCFPPRFDIFCDKIVGSWKSPEGTPLDVDEVMRSCGGAVQGIQDDTLYLNRADDGFCFFDCGTYSYGPITGYVMDSSDLIVTSFALTTNTRIVIKTKTNLPLSSKSHMVQATLARTYRVQNASSTSWTQHELEVPIIMKPSFTIARQMQCRMSSPHQTWMMQRARWEYTSQGLNGNRMNPKGPYRCWVEQKEGSIIMGVSCVATGYVKELVRTYDDSGKLTNIRLQDGGLL